MDVLYHAQKENILSVELPQTVVLEITYTEPGIKGDTATNTLKPATVETGAEVRVPSFATTEMSSKLTPPPVHTSSV